MSDTEASLDFRFQRLLGARVAPQQSPVLQTTFFNVSLTRQGCNFAATSSQSLRATIHSGLFKLSIASIYDLSGSHNDLPGPRARWKAILVGVSFNVAANLKMPQHERLKKKSSYFERDSKTLPCLSKRLLALPTNRS